MVYVSIGQVARRVRNVTADQQVRMLCLSYRRMTHSSVTMERIYSDARAERDGKSYFIEPEMTRLFERSRDYDKLQWAWLAWRNATGPHLRTPFAQTVSDLNEAARQNGRRSFL